MLEKGGFLTMGGLGRGPGMALLSHNPAFDTHDDE
jgi:hypothetical protein